MPKRFEKYGLTIQPEKTRLVPFDRPQLAPRPPDGRRRESPGTFEFLGLTHVWSRSLKGNPEVKRRTSPARFRRGLWSLKEWFRHNLHLNVAAQHQALCRKMTGHFAYHGVTGNAFALSRFWVAVVRLWRRNLSRRHRDGRIDWDRFNRLLVRYPLPPPTPIHSVCRPAESS